MRFVITRMHGSALRCVRIAILPAIMEIRPPPCITKRLKILRKRLLIGVSFCVLQLNISEGDIETDPHPLTREAEISQSCPVRLI